jgi:hypothetical protein
VKNCIFCQSNGPFASVSHIIPESLGGPLSPVAPPGITCDGCNQYFGQKVELSALASFPFSAYRLLNSIPTKKGKMTSIPTTLGRIHAYGSPGLLDLEPRNQGSAENVLAGKITTFRVLAEVTEPLAVCRMLLKIGLETLAKHFHDVAISTKVQDAIRYARSPKRGEHWWFYLYSNPEEVIASRQTSEDEIPSIEIMARDEILFSVLRLPGIATLTPLERCNPAPLNPEDRLIRLIWATC